MAADWLARLESFEIVDSTNDVVSGWLRAGTPEVCIAIADEQRAGRGRNGRTWVSPPGASLLLSAGFRPSWLEASHVWRLGAIVSLAMAEAAEVAASLPGGSVLLKWPNDLVVRGEPGLAPRKLAGVLGETRGLGTPDPEVVIGIGINVDWGPESLPAAVGQEATTLSEAAGLDVSRDRLQQAFLSRLGRLVEDLHAGRFPAADWRARQATAGEVIRVERPDGTTEQVRAVDVDLESGALMVEPLEGGPRRAVTVGDIRHVRLVEV